VAVKWSANGEIPLVCGDGDALLQVFLNIVRNANRALQEQPCKLLRISVAVDRGRVTVSFTNSGPPVKRPELLFEPFQPGASERGLGLYVSRAILKSFGGDLVYCPEPEGCCFAVVLLISQFWCGGGNPTTKRRPQRPMTSNGEEGTDELKTQGNRL
jgi:signal transduction histidine kinase